jgi:hypothetical protein
VIAVGGTVVSWIPTPYTVWGGRTLAALAGIGAATERWHQVEDLGDRCRRWRAGPLQRRQLQVSVLTILSLAAATSVVYVSAEAIIRAGHSRPRRVRRPLLAEADGG